MGCSSICDNSRIARQSLDSGHLDSCCTFLRRSAQAMQVGVPLGGNAASREERPCFVRNDVPDEGGRGDAVMAHTALSMNDGGRTCFRGSFRRAGPGRSGRPPWTVLQAIRFRSIRIGPLGPWECFLHRLAKDENSLCRKRKTGSAGHCGWVCGDAERQLMPCSPPFARCRSGSCGGATKAGAVRNRGRPPRDVTIELSPTRTGRAQTSLNAVFINPRRFHRLHHATISASGFPLALCALCRGDRGASLGPVFRAEQGPVRRF